MVFFDLKEEKPSVFGEKRTLIGSVRLMDPKGLKVWKMTQATMGGKAQELIADAHNERIQDTTGPYDVPQRQAIA